MAIHITNFENEPIILMTLEGQCQPSDIVQAFADDIFPHCRAIDPNIMHILYDITKLDWTFSEFIQYISMAHTQREKSSVPLNSSQYFIGSTKWAESIRDWLSKQYNQNMGVFTDLDSALEYIRSQIP